MDRKAYVELCMYNRIKMNRQVLKWWLNEVPVKVMAKRMGKSYNYANLILANVKRYWNEQRLHMFIIK